MQKDDIHCEIVAEAISRKIDMRVQSPRKLSFCKQEGLIQDLPRPKDKKHCKNDFLCM